jgi:hypothetical protein
MIGTVAMLMGALLAALGAGWCAREWWGDR